MTAAAPGPTRRRRRIKAPSILQMEQVECGAACLNMVLAYHGRWVPLEDVRRLVGVSRDGTNAANLLKAARRYGMVAKGFRKPPEGLDSLPVPSIIHWNFNHFVVYEGRRGERVFINDPASGRREVTPQELDEAFTGVVLAFEPGEAFERGGEPPRSWSHLVGHLRSNGAAIALVAILSLFLVIPGVVLPGLARVFIDDVLVPGRDDWAALVVLAVLITGMTNASITALQQHYLLRLEGKLALSIAGRYMHRILSLPMNFFLQRSVGDLVNRVGAAERIGQLLSGTLAQNVFNLIAVVFFAAAMALFDPILAAIGVTLSLVNVMVVHAFREPREAATRKLRQDQGKLLSAASGSIRSLETLKSGGGENDAFGRFSGHQVQALSSRQALGIASALLLAAPGVTGALTTTAILGVGGLRVMDGALTIGSLIAIQALMARFTQPIAGLVGLASDIQAIRADLGRLDDAANYPVEPEAAAAAENLPEPQGEVALMDVTFGHAPLDPPLIENLSLTMAPGSRIALVGGSGSGKSTVGRLIAGLFRPWSGTIRIDGIVLDAMPPEHLGARLAHVDQEIFLFEGTVRENLTLWDADVSDATLEQALASACIRDEIAQRPGFLDAHIAEGGANFSGGQRQRLELARALVHSPAVLVLDEATSALDPDTEKTIDDNLRRQGSTCLIIAHRLSTIRDADEIIVLDSGRVVERGSHADLLAANGRYTSLVAGQ